MMKKTLCDNSGITLVETMVAMVLSVVVMGAVYMAFEAQQKNAQVQEQVSFIQQDLRVAVASLEKDIHNAGCNPYMKATIQAMNADSSTTEILNLTMDYSSSGLIDARDENVTYYLSGTNFIRQDNTPSTLTQTLATNVTNVDFNYLDESGSSISPTGATVASLNSLSSADIDKIRSIEITITVRSNKKDPDIDAYITRTITRTIKGRNMGLN